MRILHLEDNPQDAELVLELLQEEWADCEVDVVDTRSDFVAQLHRSHEVILADFTLPSFDGLSALKLAREVKPGTPFIFVSGSIGEERAIEAVRTGACDYVLKDHMKRLATAIRRACTDVAEKRKLEEKFLRIQRIETIGMLAAGIAHDLNNVMAPIALCVPALRQRTADPVDLKLLGALEKSAERGADLVRQIVAFARGASGERHPVQMKDLAHDIIAVMRQTFPKTISFEHQLPADLWLVDANPTQMHQVLLNLCVNARDAMPGGGTLSLRARNAHLEAGAAGVHRAPPGPYLRLEVGDTGTGVPPEMIERIWEPFFTTKEATDGTGLGLSTVRGIVENHRGFIELESEVGRGSTFTLYLPAAGGGTSPASEPAAPALP